MDIDTIKLLAEVARLGSFAAVARARDCDPSVVSRSVAQAEETLGVRLFHRTTRRLALSEQGRTFIDRVAPITEDFDEAVEAARRAQNKIAGTVRLTASVAFAQICVVPHLQAFRRTFPALRLDLVSSDTVLDLVRERIDLAIRLAPDIEGDLIRTRLHATRYRVCASPNYLRTAQPLLRPEDLAGHPCLLFPYGDYRRRWLFRDRDTRVQEVPVDGPVVLSSALALRQAAIDGLGPALLADWLIDDDIAGSRLVDVFPDFDVAATRFDTAAWLAYPSRAFLPARTRCTIDFLKGRLASNAMGM